MHKYEESKRLELWWQLYVTWLRERDLENFRPLDFKQRVHVRTSSVGLLPSAFAVLCCMLDAELFPDCELISHGEHFVSIMRTLSLAFVFCPQSTQSTSTIINIDSGVCLTQWYAGVLYVGRCWNDDSFTDFITFRMGCCCILLKYRHWNAGGI
jgi:hypothetical protein